MKKEIDTIIIDISGGLVQSVVSNRPLRVITIDYEDAYQVDESDKIIDIEGKQAYTNDFGVAYVDPEFIRNCLVKIKQE